jgi:hypothetical protein
MTIIPEMTIQNYSEDSIKIIWKKNLSKLIFVQQQWLL